MIPGRMLNKQLVKCLLDNLQEQYPGVPDKAGYSAVMEHLRRTVEEKGNIRALIHIMEELENKYMTSYTAMESYQSAV